MRLAYSVTAATMSQRSALPGTGGDDGDNLEDGGDVQALIARRCNIGV